MLKHLLLIKYFWEIQSLVFAQVGERCTIRKSEQDGICKLEPDCLTALQQAKIGIAPTLCGFYGMNNTKIVCCTEIISDVRGNISEKKCEEYNRPITKVSYVISLDSEPQERTISSVKCDYNTVPLIVGGEPASPGEFPFMAAVGFNTSSEPWRCGGTLISDRFVLTAAHCTFSIDAGAPSVIRLGDIHLINGDSSKHKDYLVSKIIIHPEYNYPEKYNDIALLKIDITVTFTNFIRPACLYTRKDIEYNKGVATGWGKLEFSGETSNILRKVTLNIFNNQECARSYRNDENLPRGIASSMICAGELKGGKDTCGGDSGGPLIVVKETNQCQFYVVGLTSFGKACGISKTPAVYTRVSEYVKWIEQTIWM